ncbi:transcription initiation factor tfiid subunit 10 [Anaeramoeba flamelloides]|uniref:Transcription initiation factor tfiid subunit 10 n=1 Tax=Anaeramoeba flamelloides TaxID=1746091 RepID=A0ABQ8XSP2_9EUKA|nr:transcription initiation factor tfiid subunit 10 [Anaeramoeba flamelloides]
MQQRNNEFVPSQNQTSCEDFIEFFEVNPTIIPDSLTRHYLSQSGFNCKDQRLVRIVSLSTQKFLYEVLKDSIQFTRRRSTKLRRQTRSRKTEKLILTKNDLVEGLKQNSVHVNQPLYFSNQLLPQPIQQNDQNNTNNISTNSNPRKRGFDD